MSAASLAAKCYQRSQASLLLDAFRFVKVSNSEAYGKPGSKVLGHTNTNHYAGNHLEHK